MSQGELWHATPYNFILAPVEDPSGAVQTYATPTFCGQRILSRTGVPLSVTDETPRGRRCVTCDKLVDSYLEGEEKE